jgi:nicotinamide mononucleotide transporter
MSTIDLLALCFGILGVILTIRETIWCWAADIISVSLQGFVFYKVRLFGDFSLQIFYFISGVYGWIHWNKYKTQEFHISKMSKKNWILVVSGIIILSIILYPILKYIKSDQVIIESILTSSSLICTYMMAKKWIENWIFWMLIDLAYVYLYLVKQLPTYAILYLFFSVMAFYGFYIWRKKLKK